MTMATDELALAAETAIAPATARAHGVWSPAMTPFDANLAPDPARFVAHV